MKFSYVNLAAFRLFSHNKTGNFRELVDHLNESTELLAKNINILDNVLETLDYQQHSLGVLYILVAKVSEVQVRLEFV